MHPKIVQLRVLQSQETQNWGHIGEVFLSLAQLSPTLFPVCSLYTVIYICVIQEYNYHVFELEKNFRLKV